MRHSALIALQAAGAEVDPSERERAAPAATPAPRSAQDAGERVSRVLVQQQRGVAVAAMVAWSCVALLLFGTLLEVWNARVELPSVDERTFAGVLSAAIASVTGASASDASRAVAEDSADELSPGDDALEESAARKADEVAQRKVKRAAPRRAIRNDRFLPRGVASDAARPAKRRAKPTPRVRPHRAPKAKPRVAPKAARKPLAQGRRSGKGSRPARKAARAGRKTGVAAKAKAAPAR